MKKTSIGLMMALFAIGCGGNPPPKVTPAPNPAADAKAKEHMMKAASDAKTDEKKDGDMPAATDEKKDGDAPAATEEKKEGDTPAEPK